MMTTTFRRLRRPSAATSSSLFDAVVVGSSSSSSCQQHHQRVRALLTTNKIGTVVVGEKSYRGGGGEGNRAGRRDSLDTNQNKNTRRRNEDANTWQQKRFVSSSMKTLGEDSSNRRLSEAFSKNLVDDIYRGSFRNQTGVSLKYMMDFGNHPRDQQLLFSAQFLHKELPIRLAHRVAELENLPFGLSRKPQVLTVRDWYVESFEDIREMKEINSMEREEKFTELLSSVMKRHNDVVPMIASGVLELKNELAEKSKKGGLNGSNSIDPNRIAHLPEIHQFLDGFYMSRIGMRMLIGQHVALHEPPKKDYVGLICTKTRALEVCKDAVDDARALCARQYGDAPEVEIFGDPNLTFAYVPGHIHHVVFELVKNSLRAVAERYKDSDLPPPAIRVVVAEGSEDVTIKISDEGGGIPRSGLKKIWTYLYSTADSPLQEMEFSEAGASSTPVVLAGYGYGLPLSRLYCRYFGGDLQVLSMDGYGTDAYVHLNRLGTGTEPLP
jgi:pyruvate dehydrogenase kinase 2/3/4